MKWFITGGAGFIGTKLIQKIVARSSADQIVVYDSLLAQVHGANAVFPIDTPQVKYVRGDVINSELLSQSLLNAGPDVVVHLASDTGTSQSMDEVARYCNVNVTGTANLLTAIRKLPKPPCFVLASSRSIYGEGPWLTDKGTRYSPVGRSTADMNRADFLPKDEAGKTLLKPLPVLESDQIIPASVYASTKYMQELLVDNLNDAISSLIILRFQNVYGEGQSLRNPYTGVLSIFCKQILEGKKLNLFEDAEISRDFIHVSDIVNGILAAVDRRPKVLVANLGSGKASTIKEVAEELLSALGQSRSHYEVSGQFRTGDIRHACADISKAKAILDWSPTVELKDGLHRLARWAEGSLK